MCTGVLIKRPHHQRHIFQAASCLLRVVECILNIARTLSCFQNLYFTLKIFNIVNYLVQHVSCIFVMRWQARMRQESLKFAQTFSDANPPQSLCYTPWVRCTSSSGSHAIDRKTVDIMVSVIAQSHLVARGSMDDGSLVTRGPTA